MRGWYAVVKDVGTNNNTCFTIRYETEEQALTHAKKQAARHGGRFLVLKCIGYAAPQNPPVGWYPAGESDQPADDAAD